MANHNYVFEGWAELPYIGVYALFAVQLPSPGKSCGGDGNFVYFFQITGYNTYWLHIIQDNNTTPVHNIIKSLGLHVILMFLVTTKTSVLTAVLLYRGVYCCA